jgi:catechol 2,3-dioxygenase-like lactoylglutathione lyase family enzyme
MTTDQSNKLTIKGFQEVVISVTDLDQHIEFYQQVAGWQLLHRGTADPASNAVWKLPADTHTEEALLHNPGDSTGYLRLLQFHDIEQQQVRSNTQTWDTGGILDFNVRVKDMAATFAQMQARGWRGNSDAIEWQFGPYHVKEWLGYGPDGVGFACIERVNPPLEGWDTLRQLSRIFNSTQTVSDMQKSYDFYTQVLDFKQVLYHAGSADKPGPNVLGLPHNLITETPHDIYILHPEGENTGSIELISFAELEGRDLSALAAPPNLGTLMLRYPVTDMSKLVNHLEQHHIAYTLSDDLIDLPPYGSVKLLALQSPEGVWLEFFAR